ncbi:hypothetical protein ACMFMG_009916 [Clarireedia jacksonii]
MEEPNPKPSFIVIYHCICTNNPIILYGPRETFSESYRSVLATFDISSIISECLKCCSDTDTGKRRAFRKLRAEGSRIYILWMEGVKAMMEKGFMFFFSEGRYTYTGSWSFWRQCVMRTWMRGPRRLDGLGWSLVVLEDMGQ